MLARRLTKFFELKRRLRWDTVMWQRHQLSRVRYILAHAQQTVPFYRELFRTAGFSTDSFLTREDLARVPFTRKDALRPLPVAERLSSAYPVNRLTPHLTGGTTGKSLEIFCDPVYEDIRVASIFRTFAYHGYRPTDRVAVFMFYPVPPRPTDKLGLFRKQGFAYGMPDADIVSELAQRQFEIFEGYPSRLRSLAEYVLARGIASIRPRAIFSNSEMLDEDTRMLIRKAFGVTPVNVYESWEFSQIAWECERHEGLHVNADLKIVEVCDGQGNPVFDAPGEIVVTDLYNNAMPFIRYCTGDEGILTQRLCACGNSFPLLQSILGRTNDKLVLNNGQVSVSVTPLFAHIKITPGVIEHQAVQERPGEVVVLVVGDENFTAEAEADMKRRIAAMYALDRIGVRRVPCIERTGVGKQRAFVSALDRQ